MSAWEEYRNPPKSHPGLNQTRGAAAGKIPTLLPESLPGGHNDPTSDNPAKDSLAPFDEKETFPDRSAR